MRWLFFFYKYTIRNLFYHKKFSILFIISLSIGLLSFLLVDAIKVSLDQYLNNSSKEIATGDIILSGRRPLSSIELKLLENRYSKENLASKINYFSMAKKINYSNQTKSLIRLIQVDSISKYFPLYGKIILTDFNGNLVDWSQARISLENNNYLVITKEMQSLFSIHADEQIQIGDKIYIAKYIIEKDIGERIRFSGISYRVYTSQKQIDLISTQKGSTTYYRYYIKTNLPDNSSDNLQELTALRNSFEKIKDTSPTIDTFTIRTHNQSRSSLERIFNFIHKYLELISLITLFLAGIGVFYLFRTFVFSKIKEIAVLESLGMKKSGKISVLIFQLLILGMCSLLLSLTTFFIFLPFLPKFFSAFIPENLEINLQFSSILSAFFMAIFGSIIFTFPIIWSSGKIKIISLIRQDLSPQSMLNVSIWSFIPMIVVFYLLSVLMGGGWYLGSIFSLLFLATILIVFLIGWLFWILFSQMKNHHRFTISFISKNIYRNRSKSFFYFFAISLSVALISLAPQIEYSISRELKTPEGVSIPTLFVFDIRKNDLPILEEKVKSYGAELDSITPIISAELKTLNGEIYQQKKQKQSGFKLNNNNQNNDNSDSHMMRNQVNISYRSKLSESESIEDGREISKNFQKGDLIEISLDYRYAKRRGLKIGDKLGFSLINVPFQFEGIVVNTRKVRWNSFQPNFFIMIQDQVLNQLPQKYLGVIKKINYQNKIKLIQSVNYTLPNVSILDVFSIIEEVLTLIGKISVLIRAMAIFCFILGLLILFSIINQEMKNQEKEINLLKVIGGKFSTIYFLVLGEYNFIGFLAIISGFIPSVLLNYFIGNFFFDGAFQFSFSILFNIFLVMLPSIFIVNFFGSRKILYAKPILLLKDN